MYFAWIVKDSQNTLASQVYCIRGRRQCAPTQGSSCQEKVDFLDNFPTLKRSLHIAELALGLVVPCQITPPDHERVASVQRTEALPQALRGALAPQPRS